MAVIMRGIARILPGLAVSVILLALAAVAVAQAPGPGADLGIEKTDSADPVKENADLTYTLPVRNNGPGPATGVEVVDPLPASVEFRSASSGCTQTDRTVRCDVGAMLPGQSEQIEIVVRPRDPGVITNSASVSGDQSDPNPGNDDAVEVTTVTAASADLAIDKSDSPDPVPVNEVLTYRLTAGNNGPDRASGVQVTDNLPATVDFDSASQGCTHSNRVVTCRVGDFDSGGTRVFEIRVRPRQTGLITDTATIGGAEPDPNSGNNSDSETTTVQQAPPTASADLDVDKTDATDPATAGEVVTYTLTVRHVGGPNSASNVVVTDDLPDNASFESASSGCMNQSGVVTCQLGAIDPGGSKSVEVRIRPGGEGELENSAFVSSATSDPNAANNDAFERTQVRARPRADLALTKTDSPDPVRAGERITYRLTVTNAGPDGATGVVVTDDLPDSVQFESASDACTQSADRVTCNAGTLADDATRTFRVRVTPTQAGTIQNTASADAAEDDPAAANNADAESTTVQGVPQDVECKGERADIVGTDANDRLVGTERSDVITGLGGNDRIRGLGGKDRICGSSGDDDLNGNRGRDDLFGNGGDDDLHGGRGRDDCVGNAGNDTARSCEDERSTE